MPTIHVIVENSPVNNQKDFSSYSEAAEYLSDLAGSEPVEEVEEDESPEENEEGQESPPEKEKEETTEPAPERVTGGAPVEPSE